MANLNILLEGKGTIDNVHMHLKSPYGSVERRLDRQSDTLWTKRVELQVDNSLEYELGVTAYSSTGFTCTITNTNTLEKIIIEGATHQSSAIIKGEKNFQP
ncbi:MAG: hypothetical protein JST68_17345 [Bacteroidetes bacterium]|nr:hypothetical protein [Bacteroidota bacterium]